MNSTEAIPETCNDAVVNVIVDGKFTPSYEAIGSANLPTLQRAAQRCAEAELEARKLRQPWKQYYYRALVVRTRIGKIIAGRRAAF